MLSPWWPLRGHAVLERTARSRSPGLCCTALGRQQRTLRLPQNRHITRSAAAPRAEAPSDRRNVGGSGAAAHLVTFEVHTKTYGRRTSYLHHVVGSSL